MSKVRHRLNQGMHATLFTICIVATVLIGLKLALVAAPFTLHLMTELPALVTVTAIMIGFIATVAWKGLIPYSEYVENLLRS